MSKKDGCDTSYSDVKRNVKSLIDHLVHDCDNEGWDDMFLEEEIFTDSEARDELAEEVATDICEYSRKKVNRK